MQTLGDAVSYFCLKLQGDMGSVPAGAQAAGADPQRGVKAVGAEHSGLDIPNVFSVNKDKSLSPECWLWVCWGVVISRVMLGSRAMQGGDCGPC